MKSNFTIGVDQIEKRKRCLSETSDQPTDLQKWRKLAIDSIKRNSPTSGSDANRFISEAANYTAANKYYETVVEFVKLIEQSDFAVPAARSIASNVVPFIVNLKEFSHAVQRVNIFNDEAAELLESAIHKNSMCDNVLRIHNSICKRFNIEGYLKENSYLPTDILVVEMCSMIDTFEGDHAEKLRASLEEITYLFDKLAVEHENADIVQYTTEYYLHKDENADPELFESYKMELNYCHLLTESDLSGIRYFLEEEEVEDTAKTSDTFIGDEPIIFKTKQTIMDLIDVFKKSPDKREETFYSLIDSIVSNYSPNEILNSMDGIINWMVTFVVNELYQNSVVVIKGLKAIISHLIDARLDSKDVVRLQDIMSNSLNLIRKYKIDQTENGEEVAVALAKLIDVSADYNKMNTNAESVKKELGIDTEEGEIYKLEAFASSYAFSDTVNAINNTKRMLEEDTQYVSAINKIATPIMITQKDFKDARLHPESIIECITESGVFDHVVAIYDVKDNTSNALVEAVANLCRYINNSIPNKTTHLYYENIESIVEIHVEDTNVIALSDTQMDVRDNAITESEMVYFGMMEHLFEVADTFNEIDAQELAENYAQIEPDLTSEQLCHVIDIAQYTGGLISSERVHEMAETYRANHPTDYYGNGCIANIISGWNQYDVDVDVMAEAVGSLNEAILNEINFKVSKNNAKEVKSNGKDSSDRREKDAGKSKSLGSAGSKDKAANNGNNDSVKDKFSKNKDKEEKRKHKEKLSLNTLKMATVSLKGKAKDLDAKAKKMSDDLDMAAEHFMSAVKELYSNDNRESVIRGSIVPSFHKLFQRGVVGVVGTGVIALFNPTYAVVTAALYVFSLIAVSKHNTEKERALLLDEINIELDVLEKELANAESHNQMKKYRQLTAYKKKLMRERQRIKYKVTYHAMVVNDNPDRES